MVLFNIIELRHIIFQKNNDLLHFGTVLNKRMLFF